MRNDQERFEYDILWSMREIDQNLLKISSSRTPLPQPLELGQEVTIIFKGDVVKTEQLDNQDGTYNQVYVVKGIVGEIST